MDRMLGLTPNQQDPVATRPVETPIEINGQLYRHHPNGGGLVAVTAKVAPSAFIDRNAMVKDFAIVSSQARLFNEAIVEDRAIVAGESTLRHHARVGGQAVLMGRSIVTHHGYVGGHVHLDGMVTVEFFAHLDDDTVIDARLSLVG